MAVEIQGAIFYRDLITARCRETKR